ncbi:hypothetical protein FN976_08135 [Caenimonas sedimenti]|uniref:Uncharacterized protein n=1 Tax=Caenimonas sedimenti TaxID=2596921 RepID=A0A562ZU69_9BURK|nr:hypothetical protein [Caenimonas sedimenti]TWO71947.1 hypothetical protein FN976_08135 [Caenimonas sedimenti]
MAIPRPFTFLLLAAVLAAGPAHAQDTAESRQLAPGFTTRPAATRLVVLPADMELFSISAGGVTEPRADWTEAAQKHFSDALQAHKGRLGVQAPAPTPAQMDEFSDVLALHRAVADAVFIHHTQSSMRLPTKQRRLDWSLGSESVQALRERTGADYALFTWIRDSYASPERKATMVAMALLGSFMLGGEQVGYASLVDLKTGRVVWFNELSRMSGDLREPQPAAETVEALLKGFPKQQ